MEMRPKKWSANKKLKIAGLKECHFSKSTNFPFLAIFSTKMTKIKIDPSPALRINFFRLACFKLFQNGKFTQFYAFFIIILGTLPPSAGVR
jgi:hypothetical protein